ncbi:hypothetical protein [Arthrobacter sp. UYEF20]|uniref:hypothetical protein n=1 Tax=Arthrobacter sp. UYEF20 TaxID=1756363 RepID=UPI00339155E3
MNGGTEHEWNNLIGRPVQVWKNGHLIRTGYVDDVAQAAGALWLEGHGVEGRALYQKADGYSAKPVCEAAP